MKELLIESKGKYSYQDRDGNRSNITSKQAWKIFKGWQDSGKKIRRKYGMGGHVTWVWPEED